jgi:hypothetical protein
MVQLAFKNNVLHLLLDNRSQRKREVVVLAAERDLCAYSAVNGNYRDGQG